MAYTTVNGDTTNAASPIIQFNPSSQLPIKLTGSVNFSTWKAQCSMLMHGHDLFGHLDGTKTTPPRTVGDTNTPNPVYNLWFRQDQLIQNALMASVDPTIAPTVANARSAHHAWDALHATYANKSQSRLFSLRDQLARLTKDTQSMSDYLHRVRGLADELAQAGAPIANEELVVQILRGLGPDYREISAAIRARDTTITYEDLHDKLLDHEVFLQHEESKKPAAPITAAVAQRTKQSHTYNPRNNRRNTQLWQPNDRINHQVPSWRDNNRQHNGRRSNANTEPVRCQLCKRPGHEADVCRSMSHNHPWPTQRSALAGSTRSQPTKSNNTDNSKITSPSSQKQKIANAKEEQKETSNDTLSPTTVAGTSSTTSAPLKEEYGDCQKQMEMDENALGEGFQHSYRPTLQESNQSEDFFADLGEIYTNPLDHLFTQGFSRDDDQKESMTMDPFSMFDW